MKPKTHVAVIQKRESIEESYPIQLPQITSQEVTLWAMLSFSTKGVSLEHWEWIKIFIINLYLINTKEALYLRKPFLEHFED